MNLWDELNLLGKAVFSALGAIIVIAISFLAFHALPSSEVGFGQDPGRAAAGDISSTTASVRDVPVSHLKTPSPVRGIYMTACIAGSKAYRDGILETLKGTSANTVIVDIKDYTGTLSYDLPGVVAPKGKGCTVADMPALVADLHNAGLYAVARITVFQDPLYSRVHPDMAVQSASHPGKPWTDRKGLAYIDPNSMEYWAHVVTIAKASHKIGFDEINFDYIRFPSDGDMSDAMFRNPPGVTKAEVIANFFDYLHSELAPAGIVTSADLFGQTTVNRDDMGIGQVLENALPHFDYVMPMDYPSHYISGFLGFANPAAHPYDVIKYTMTSAVERAAAASTSIEKLRPWLQAFDLGADYTPEMIRAQVNAVHDAGLSSWVLWDAANRYKREQFFE